MDGLVEVDDRTDVDATANHAAQQAAAAPTRGRPRYRIDSRYVRLDVSAGREPPTIKFSVARVPCADAERMFCIATGCSPAQLGALNGTETTLDAGARTAPPCMPRAYSLAFNQATRQFCLLLQELRRHIVLTQEAGDTAPTHGAALNKFAAQLSDARPRAESEHIAAEEVKRPDKQPRSSPRPPRTYA